MNSVNLSAPLERKALSALSAGDAVCLSGPILTARDAAHKRIYEMLLADIPLPFSLENACIYYTGPCPAAPGEVIGPCGPTTSGRVDKYTPLLISRGLAAMIGKGERSLPVLEALRLHGAVYFGATGGAAMLIQACVKSCEVIAFPELGPEAVHLLHVEKMPLIVLCDSHGGNLYAR